MTRRFLLVSGLIISLSMLAGCTSPQKASPESGTVAAGASPAPKARAAFERVGVVTLVNAQSSFVLIESDLYALPASFTLKTFVPSASPAPEGETAVLKVSPERAGRFMVADIVSGSPGKGDVVYR